MLNSRFASTILYRICRIASMLHDAFIGQVVYAQPLPRPRKDDHSQNTGCLLL